MASAQLETPTIPRPSASLVVINAKNEVLMVQRHSNSRSFAGAYVFPGGNYDEIQDNSMEMTAIRETFEETGILLASESPRLGVSRIPESVYEEARKAIHAGKLLFKDFLSGNGLATDTGSLLPFSTWVTPPSVSRRFRTRFFVTFLSVASTVAGPTLETLVYRLPSPDSPDNDTFSSTEVVSAKFIHPRDTLSAFARGDIGLMPPQYYILTILRDIFGSGADADTNTPVQREQVVRVSRSAFGRMEFNPQPLHGTPGKSPDGCVALVLEGDETRGGKEGHLHRTLFFPQTGTTLPRKLELIRNFDIFTDSEGVTPSKL